MKYSILPYVLDSKYWKKLKYPIIHMTGHCYYNSPYETDSNCGNCDGGGCDSCSKITESIEFDYDKIDEVIRKAYPDKAEEIISDLSYDDWRYPIYEPTESVLKIYYPEEYEKIMAELESEV